MVKTLEVFCDVVGHTYFDEVLSIAPQQCDTNIQVTMPINSDGVLPKGRANVMGVLCGARPSGGHDVEMTKYPMLLVSAIESSFVHL
jgi:hypothetical protein